MSDYRVFNDNGYERTWEELYEDNVRFQKYTDKLEKENQKLKKQLEEYENELEKADSITHSCIFNGKEESKISYRKCLNILDKKETQQKEFIKWLEDYINLFDNMCIDEQGYYDMLEEILQKYKSIIGVSDENNMEKSK